MEKGTRRQNLPQLGSQGVMGTAYYLPGRGGSNFSQLTMKYPKLGKSPDLSCQSGGPLALVK